MHFTWDISFGNIVASLSVLGAALGYHRTWVKLIQEHRLMWLDFCRRHHISRDPDFQQERD